MGWSVVRFDEPFFFDNSTEAKSCQFVFSVSPIKIHHYKTYVNLN